MTVDGLIAGLATLRKEVARLEHENGDLHDRLARLQASGLGSLESPPRRRRSAPGSRAA